MRGLGLCALQHASVGVWPFWSGPLNHNCQIDKWFHKRESLTCNFELHSHWTWYSISIVDTQLPIYRTVGALIMNHERAYLSSESWLNAKRLASRIMILSLFLTIMPQFSLIIICYWFIYIIRNHVRIYMCKRSRLYT